MLPHNPLGCLCRTAILRAEGKSRALKPKARVDELVPTETGGAAGKAPRKRKLATPSAMAGASESAEDMDRTETADADADSHVKP
jgi:hypothetical protein